MQVQQVAAQAGFEHIAGVGEAARRFRRGFHIGFRQAPGGAELDVQAHFGIGYAGQHLRSRADVRQGLRLVGGERPGAREVDEEQVILDQVMPERRFRQAAGAQLPNEFVPDIGVPLRPGAGPQPVEQRAFVNGFRRSLDHIKVNSCGRPQGRYATRPPGAFSATSLESVGPL